MREVISDIDRWRDNEEDVALATVVETWGSAPRGTGAKMALTEAGEISGSVSGGCVEGAVFEAGVETLQSGQAQLLSFGVADETAWEVGLACGGQIQVFVERLQETTYETMRRWLSEDRSGAVATIVAGPPDLLGRKVALSEEGATLGGLGAGFDEAAISAMEKALAAGQSRRVTLDAEPDSIELFIEAIQPPPTLIMVGGVHIAVALTTMAKSANYRTIIVDPRRAFGSEERFPHVDQLIQAWPEEAFAQIKLTPATAVAMLTHDPKIDDPALQTVLPSPAFYVGALGSTTTHQKRRRRLLDAGVAQELVDRIKSPIGLDINARTPEEIAVAVLAEVVAARRAKDGQA